MANSLDTHALRIAGVPEHLHAEALASMAEAKKRAKGLLWQKIKARWFNAGKIAAALPWEADRLLEVKPDWWGWDIAPVLNVTAHGDNGPWHETPDGGRPDAHYWANPDPDSAEYKEAVSKNYWCKGQHPRSKASRKAWYRRNAGEFLAWKRGAPIDPAQGFEIWRGTEGSTQVIAWRACGAWIVKSSRKWGPFRLNTRVGFEIDNVYSGNYAPQMWWPIPGYDLRAPVTNSTMPGKKLDLSLKRWAEPHTVATAQGTYTKLESV